MKNKGLLSEFDFFSDTPQDKLAKIEQQCDIQDFEMNDLIFQINRSAEELYGVINGEVELFITFWDKKMSEANIRYQNHVLPQLKILQTPIIVDTIKNGEIFGWSSMLKHRKWTASARCTKKTRIFSIPAIFIKDILYKDSAIGYNIMERLCDIILRRLQTRTESMFERKINAIGKMLNFIN